MKQTAYALLVVYAFIFLVFSHCTKNPQERKPPGPLQLEFALVKKKFDSLHLESSLVDKGNGTINVRWDARWEQIVKQNTGINSYYYVPLKPTLIDL